MENQSNYIQEDKVIFQDSDIQDQDEQDYIMMMLNNASYHFFDVEESGEKED